jgi:hypothetical protein
MLAVVWLAWAGMGLVGVVILLAIAFWPARVAHERVTVGCCFSCSASSSSPPRPSAPMRWGTRGRGVVGGRRRDSAAVGLHPGGRSGRPFWPAGRHEAMSIAGFKGRPL